jgi:hypothetical protein
VIREIARRDPKPFFVNLETSETTRKDPDVPLLEDGSALWFPYSLKISVKLLGTNFTRHILR